jgi:hypothetical protein
MSKNRPYKNENSAAAVLILRIKLLLDSPGSKFGEITYPKDGLVHHHAIDQNLFKF